MTVSSAYVPDLSDGDGVSVIFPVTFRFDSLADVRCTIYAVDGTPRTPAVIVAGSPLPGGGYSGGSVQITDGAPLVGEKVLRSRETTLLQQINYTSGNFPSDAHERSADRLVMAAQERARIAGRTLRFSDLSSAIQPIPPIALGRALIRTADGFGEGPNATDIANAQANAAAALQSAIDAAASAVLAATFNPALYALKGSTQIITAAWTFNSFGTFSAGAKFGAAGVLQFGAADEAKLDYSAGLRIEADSVLIRAKTGAEAMISAVLNGAVTLFFDAAAKLATAASGIVVTGSVIADTIAGAWRATQAEGEAGTAADKVMTPERTRQAIAFRSFAVAQTWQELVGSRAIGTTYQNTSSKPIKFKPRVTQGAATNVVLETSPDNSVWSVIVRFQHNIGSTFTDHTVGSVEVPPGFYYRVRSLGGSNTLTSWMELF